MTELEKKAIQAMKAFIHGDYPLPYYDDEKNFIRLADEAKGELNGEKS